ncbi:unnamed protein product [Dicrocoelium dendriticum]|nr:unnamed protein product [Dicrocoelium dendriticum]
MLLSLLQGLHPLFTTVLLVVPWLVQTLWDVPQNHFCFADHVSVQYFLSYHRNIFLFVCLRKSCQSEGLNWVVLRSQSIDSGSSRLQIRSETEWALDDDETEEPPTSGWKTSPGNTSVQCTSSDLPQLTGPFAGRFINVYEEQNIGNSNETDILRATDSSPAPSSVESPNFAEWFETANVELAFVEEDDNAPAEGFSGAMFDHLASRGEYGCEDIRYSWRGVPIFNGSPPKELLRHLTCSRCGSHRVFEFQIFSAINNCLKLDVDKLHSSVLTANVDLVGEDVDPSWLLQITTVLVFSCSSSCWTTSDTWVPECIVVQTDENKTCIRVDDHVVVCS